MALQMPSTTKTQIVRLTKALYDAAPGATYLSAFEGYVAEANMTTFANWLASTVSNDAATLAATVVASLKLTGTTATEATNYLVSQLNANPGNYGAVILNAMNGLANMGNDPIFGAAATAFNQSVTIGYTYSTNVLNTSTDVATLQAADEVSAAVVATTLTTGMDNLVGTEGAESFKAYIVDNQNTLQSGDIITGGAGTDSLFADIGNSQWFAITPETTGVETVKIRAQTIDLDLTDNNTSSTAEVQIDAQRMQGVTTWESNNSRADLLIEDVRILDSQITKDITIAMVETDPGHVDFGVYFDQLSLRNASSTSSTLTIQIMDTGAAGAPATAATPLLNNPYDQFKLGINGVLTTIQLDKVAVAAADTYEALLVVFQNALQTAGSGITVALGANFTITDPISNTQVTGKSIVLSGSANYTISAPAGSGWFNTTGASVPPTSNIYTTYNDAQAVSTELVTSKVILDDVGRGSVGGDLVIGGLSVGDTSSSKGVERFEIEVRDNSKLQTINSTNNTLKEVTIVNGVTTSQSNAYVTTVQDAGDLTVNGTVGNPAASANVPGSSALSGINAALPGTNTQHNAFGFSDVRLIDGSAMRGDLAFTAEVTTASIGKYLNLRDAAPAQPATDNVAFVYSGGAGNDTMAVTLDNLVVGSTSTLTGREDFTFTANGGAGNDSITLQIGGDDTANWYVDQKQNRNITINGDAGNDTIRTPGAGDVKINAGDGNDTVYADNSGVVGAKWVINDATPAVLTDLVTSSAVNGFMYNGKVTVTFSGAGGTGVGGAVTSPLAAALVNGFEVTANIPTGTNYAVTQLQINQAIKLAINGDSVLSKVLSVVDGPANTLVISSLIDGTFNANDIRITVSSTDVTTLAAADTATVLAAYKTYAHDSTALIAAAQVANAATTTAFNGVAGMDTNQVLGGGTTVGVAVAVTTQGVTAVKEVFDVTITTGAGAATDTLTFDAYTYTAGGVETVTTVATNFVAGYNASGGSWTAASTGGVITFTNNTAVGVTDVTAGDFVVAGVGATIADTVAAPTTQGVTGVAEVFTATFSGTAAAGEIITFDGLTTGALLAGDTAGVIAAAITGAGVTYAGVAAGAVVTFTAAATGAITDATSNDFVDNLVANGTISTATSDNTINLGAGTTDTAVLGTGALSNDTLVWTGYDQGKDTIVNFEDGTVTVTALDKLNFTSYLVDKSSASGSLDSQVRIATTLNGDANVDANSVTVLTTAVFTATDTFSGLTAAKLLSALNSTNTGALNYAGITSATLDALNTYVATTLVGGVGHGVVAIENSGNDGEYALYELTFNGTATNVTADFSAATLIGVVDFGHTIAWAAALV